MNFNLNQKEKYNNNRRDHFNEWEVYILSDIKIIDYDIIQCFIILYIKYLQFIKRFTKPKTYLTNYDYH